MTKMVNSSDDARLNAAIGKRRRQLREASELTQEGMSRLLDMGRSTYSLYEAGLRALPIDVAIQFASHFGVPLDWLLAGNSTNLSLDRMKALGLDRRR